MHQYTKIRLDSIYFSLALAVLLWGCFTYPPLKLLEDYATIQQAIDSGRKGDSEAIENLFYTLLESDTYAEEAKRALLAIGDVVPYTYDFWYPQHKNSHRILTLIQEMGPVAFVQAHKGKFPESFLLDPWYVFHDRTFKELLVAINTEAAKAALVEALRAEYLDNSYFRAQAAIGLGEYGDATLIPILVEELANPNQRLETRAAIAEALGRLKDRSGLGLALDVLHSGNPIERSYAIKALAVIPGDDVTAVLEKALQRRYSLDVKFDIANALAERKSSAGFDIAVAGLRYWVDGKRIYLFNSVELFVKIGRKDAIPYLQEVIQPSLLSKVPSYTEEERAAIERAIKLLQDK